MILRSVKSGEIVIIVLYLGTLINGKAHSGKDIYKLISYRCDRMKITLFLHLGRHGYIDLLALIAELHFFFLQLGIDILKKAESPLFCLIDCFSEVGLLLCGNLRHLFHKSGKFSLLGVKKAFLKLIESF